MVSFKQRRKHKNNSGFSLVEVLMAVLLLGLIAAPVLQMFYSSYAINKKSKEYLVASDFLQTIMEGISAQTWEESETVTGKVKLDGLKKYYNSLKTGDNGVKAFVVYSVDYKDDPNGKVVEVSGAPKGKVVATSKTGAEYDSIKISNISYGVYDFAVKYDFISPPTEEASNDYWTETIEVTVYLLEKNKDGVVVREREIQTASTQIPNTR